MLFGVLFHSNSVTVEIKGGAKIYLTLPDGICMFLDQKAKTIFKKGKDRKVVILRPFLLKWQQTS